MLASDQLCRGNGYCERHLLLALVSQPPNPLWSLRHEKRLRSNRRGSRHGEEPESTNRPLSYHPPVHSLHCRTRSPSPGLMVRLPLWMAWPQVETAMSQGISPIEDGFSLILKKNGRIGARSKGCPPWGTLVGDVEKRREAGMDVSNI